MFNVRYKRSDLPSSLQAALNALGYIGKDIPVDAGTEFEARTCVDEGKRGFLCNVNLATGEHKVIYSSWGGANMFVKNNPVDLGSTIRPIPEGFAIIQGQGSNWAYITMRPENFNKLLPVQQVDLTPGELIVLKAIKGIKSSYRQNHIAYECGKADLDPIVYGPNTPECLKLKELGLITINKAGAMSATTEGKNRANYGG